MSKTTECAFEMFDILDAQDDWMHQEDMRVELMTRGVDVDYVQAAAKWLRDRGIAVETLPGGRDSMWGIASTSKEYLEYTARQAMKFFSELVSEARAMAGKPDWKKGRNKIVTHAINFGAELGIDAAEVVELCKSRPMPAGWTP